eukprot:8057634-Lingulodinium_polyedra.AAC.1
MECASREMRGAAAAECVPERIYAQFSHKRCPEMRSETHSIAAAPRVLRCAHFMDRAPDWRLPPAKL